MKKMIVCVLLVIFALISCEQNKDEVTAVINTVDTVQIVDQQVRIKDEKNVDFSPYAVKDFLLPLDKYSWEKEFETEFVIVHFTSNVVNDRNNPYDLDKIREIFEINEVSTHYIIDRDGVIYCYIPETHSAWHAGKGDFADDEKYTDSMNKYSVGIELVGIGSQNDMSQYLTACEYDLLEPSLAGFTDKQYDSLRKLVVDICQRNEIPFDRQHVIGHSEYNDTKADPGELFCWERIFER